MLQTNVAPQKWVKVELPSACEPGGNQREQADDKWQEHGDSAYGASWGWILSRTRGDSDGEYSACVSNGPVFHGAVGVL